MKFNFVNLTYLCFRLAPLIIVSYFLLQLIFNRDIISIIYLFGLILACLFTLSIGNYNFLYIFSFFKFIFGLKTDEKNTKERPLCNFLRLGKTEHISKLPLNPTILGFSLFFVVFIITKNAGGTIDWKKLHNVNDKLYPTVTITNEFITQNVALLVILPLFILSDIAISITYQCNNFNYLLISLILGSAFGLFFAVSMDGFMNPRWKEIGICGKNRLCPINLSNAIFASKASGKTVDLSQFNVFNNSICDQPHKNIYKCRMVSQSGKTPQPLSDYSNTTKTIDEINKITTDSTGSMTINSAELTTTINAE